MIPKGWKRKPLANIATIQTGIAKGSKRLNDPVELPYLRVANVQDGYLDLSVIKKIELDKSQVERYRLHVGDVLLTEGGDFDKLGRGAVWKGEIENCVHQNHIFVARPNPEILLPEFLSLLTGSSYGKAYFLSCSKQSTNLASINSSQLKDFPTLFPPLPEQIAIAKLLFNWDETIEKTERLIEAKEKQKNAFMQSLLTGNQRLKGFQEPWMEFHLGELFKERSERANDHLPLLSITREEGVIPRSEDRKDTSSEDKSNYLRICPGDIGYNTMRMWQGVSALSSLEGIVSPAYTICTPRKGVDGEFMAYLFKLPRVINLFYRYSQGLTSDTWNLKYHHFRQIRVTIPEIKEQKAIARVLKGCDEEIDLLKKQADALRRQKRGLMQKLLTGAWRVNEGVVS
ncbi:restriction endonuclease subunit S [Geobacter benzoatilyticus]|uniref:Restriction endonuclease subunit S n=1 Tax=Geobacter benzoatilyticus TaxID=2815309 RepID=A0ABX7Q733_9BACT|nr:restriction endonuclease subunit S [Geobacter benzoatilyticus]QSV46911.1 restriction endonuclease subunit S [Geobacter benzoatilyticus]